MRNWIIGLILGGILLFGLSLRLYHLTDVPHGFFGDEAAIGYNAYTILHFGTDEYGRVFPLFFQSFGDYKDPLQIYFTSFFVLIFGLSEFSTRLPSVFWGVLTILGVYFLTCEIKKSHIAGLFAAFAAATMPWLIHYNRVGFELNSYACLWILTIYALVKAQKSVRFFYLASIFLGLTLYSYQPAKLLVPLLVIGWLLTYHHILKKHKHIIFQNTFVFLLFAIPMAISFFDATATARFGMVSVFSAHLPLGQTLLRIISNYFYQLSPAFFLTGEHTFITRHFTHGLLPLLFVTLPFLIIGIFFLLRHIQKASSQFVLWALVLYPIAGAVVADPPFSSRSVIGAPLFAVFIGVGVDVVMRLGKYKIGKIIVGTTIASLILLNTGIFTKYYFTQYPLYSSDFWGWQYGAAPIMQYFLTHKNEYDDLVMAGDFNGANIFLKFYDPTHICSQCSIGKPQDIYDPKRKQLFALTPDDISKDPSFTYHPVGQILYPDTTKAFLLVTVEKRQ